MLETPLQRGREIQRWFGFETCDDALPPFRNERNRHLTDAQMIVCRIQSAIGLDGKIEIAVPVVLDQDISTGRGYGEGKQPRVDYPEPVAVNPNVWFEAADRCCPVVIAIVGQQDHLQE